MPLTMNTPPAGIEPANGAHILIGYITDIEAAYVHLTVDSALMEKPDFSKLYRIGAFLKTPIKNGFIFGSVQSVREIKTDEKLTLTIQLSLLGELKQAEFCRGIKCFPPPNNPVYATTFDELQDIFSPATNDTISLGKIYPSESLTASLKTEALLSRHFAVLGSTGTGKSSCVALLIHRLVEKHPNAHIVILDPHNEYESAFSENGVHISVDTLALPYWLMNFEEHVELLIGRNTEGQETERDILKRCLFEARKLSSKPYALQRLTVDTPIPYKLTDLINAIEVELGRFDKAEGTRPFLKLKHKIEELRNDRRFSFMFSGMMVQDTLTDIIAKLLRFPTEGRPISTLDLSAIPSDIVDVVVSLLSRLVFDFAMWSKQHAAATPILLVCEEAHRYVPHARMDIQTQSARKSLERIAKEGRKYGVSLGLVSQRPSDLSEAVLSQCGTLISMRLNNGRDQHFVRDSMPDGAESFLTALPTLQNRECIIAGEGTVCPMRVHLDFLETHKRPASDDPNFDSSWRQDVDCFNNLVNDTIDKWRHGVRG